MVTFKRKILLVTLLVTGIVLFGFRELFSGILLRELGKVDDTQLRKNGERLLSAIENTVEQLHIRATKLAFWDETYRFVNRYEREYVRSNLHVESLETNHVSLVNIWNRDRQLIQRAWREVGAGSRESLSEVETQLNQIISQLDDQNYGFIFSQSGLLNTPRRVYAFTIVPILTSELRGPHRGFLAMAEEITSQHVGSYSLLLRLPLRWVHANEGRVAPGFSKAYRALRQEKIEVRKPSVDFGESYVRIDDYQGRPALLFSVEAPRIAYREMLRIRKVVDQAFIVFGVCVTLMMLFLANKFVLKRMMVARQFVRDTLLSGDFSRRIDLSSRISRDEIGTVMAEINLLLEHIEHLKKQLPSKKTTAFQIRMDPAILQEIDQLSAKLLSTRGSSETAESQEPDPNSSMSRGPAFVFISPDSPSETADVLLPPA